MSRISVVVPTQNRPLLLNEALESLSAQTLQPTEIIVVDDASEIPISAEDLLLRYGPKVKLLRNDTLRGLAYCRNLGVEAASGDFVVHLDDDDLFAPDALELANEMLTNHPEIELLFIGAQGFGPNCGYFNRVQPEAVARVIARGAAESIGGGLYRFGARLLEALLYSVPIAFQRVILKPELWHRVSALRRRSYRLNPGIADDEGAKLAISGPLRDSEWALYAAAICRASALLDRPLYLQRCAGQGYSSLPSNKDLHMHQSLAIKTQLLRASTALPELSSWRAAIRESLSSAFFDASYTCFNRGDRAQAWRYLWRSFRMNAQLRHVRFALRTLLPRAKRDE